MSSARVSSTGGAGRTRSGVCARAGATVEAKIPSTKAALRRTRRKWRRADTVELRMRYGRGHPPGDRGNAQDQCVNGRSKMDTREGARERIKCRPPGDLRSIAPSPQPLLRAGPGGLGDRLPAADAVGEAHPA